VLCFADYINLDDLTPSRSGLYADSLPGVDVELVDGLRKSGKDSDDTWTLIYNRACKNLVSDISKGIQDKFYVDFKQVSRDTSNFLTTYNSAGLAGVKLTFNFSRYTQIHIISLSVWSQTVYTGAVIRIYDTDENGELLETITSDLVAGRNTINVDSDFDANILFVAIDTAIYSVKGTENKPYHGGHYTPVLCDFVWGGGSGLVEQINGGGINIKYTVYCSIEKFVCDNINLFTTALWWKIGLELTYERRYGERLNRFTIFTVERATELYDYYFTQYTQELSNCLKSQNIQEDYICFNCKNIVSVQTQLP
jgi:hypothetical protein